MVRDVILWGVPPDGDLIWGGEFWGVFDGVGKGVKVGEGVCCSDNKLTNNKVILLGVCAFVF